MEIPCCDLITVVLRQKPAAAGVCAKGPTVPSWATRAELCLRAWSRSGISACGVQLLTVPFSISGNKRFKNAHKHSCLFLQEVRQEGKWSMVLEASKFFRTCPCSMLTPHILSSSNTHKTLKMAIGSQGGCGDMVLSQKEQCLMESRAACAACPAAPCLCKGHDSSVQGSRGAKKQQYGLGKDSW